MNFEDRRADEIIRERHAYFAVIERRASDPRVKAWLDRAVMLCNPVSLLREIAVYVETCEERMRSPHLGFVRTDEAVDRVNAEIQRIADWEADARQREREAAEGPPARPRPPKPQPILDPRVVAAGDDLCRAWTFGPR